MSVRRATYQAIGGMRDLLLGRIPAPPVQGFATCAVERRGDPPNRLAVGACEALLRAVTYGGGEAFLNMQALW